MFKSCLNKLLFYLYTITFRKFIVKDIKCICSTEVVNLRDEIVYTNINKLTRKIDNINAAQKVIFIAPQEIRSAKICEILRRARFYLPGVKVEVVRDFNSENKYIDALVIVTSEFKNSKLVSNHFSYGIYDLDYETNPFEGWMWHKLAQDVFNNHFFKGKLEFSEMIAKVKDRKLDRAILFGTGPTLGKYKDLDTKNAYKVVCNTVVKDKDFFNFVKPDIIVAADTIYHFGPSGYARTFRKDLYDRLYENKGLYFVFPEIFTNLVLEEFGDLMEQLYPIPTKDVAFPISTDLTENFYLANVGNILPFMLLPLGCTLSKKVELWGFDGRAPNDNLFWSHSKSHDYNSEHYDELQQMHPAFFELHIPKDDQSRYARENLGESLDSLLSDVENKGWNISMLHDSYTLPLKKRYKSTRNNIE